MLVRGEGAVGLNADPPVPPPKGGASGRETVAVRKKLWKEQCCGRKAVAAAWKELLMWSRTGEPGEAQNTATGEPKEPNVRPIQPQEQNKREKRE